MPIRARLLTATAGLPALLISSLMLCSCGDDPPPPPPSAYDQDGQTDVDTSLDSSLDASDVDYSTSTFTIDESAENGTIDLDPDTGDFTLYPDQGFEGTDSFLWEVSDAWGTSNIAEFTIDVAQVVVQQPTPASHDALVATR